MVTYRLKRSLNSFHWYRKADKSKTGNKDNKMQSGVRRDPDGPPDNLGQMIADYIRSMSEVLVSNEFRDFVLWAHQELQADDIRPLLWAHPPPPSTPHLDWQVIDQHLALDVRQLHLDYRIAEGSQPMPEDYKVLKALWAHEFNTAVRILGTNKMATRNYIRALADGKVTSYGGIYQLLRQRDSRELAYQLARATANLDWFFKIRGDAEGEIAMRSILERIKGRYFTRCCLLQDDSPVYSLSEFAVNHQQMKHFGAAD
ncbi:MAG: hypothetical protein Q9168_007452 [Polycauliona sp. 1 TL-2023]